MQKFTLERTSSDFNLRVVLCDGELVGRIYITYDVKGQLQYFITDVLGANVIEIKLKKTKDIYIDEISFKIFSFIDNINRK